MDASVVALKIDTTIFIYYLVNLPHFYQPPYKEKVLRKTSLQNKLKKEYV